MPNYSSGVLVNGQALATKKSNSPELRRQMPSIFELALRNQSISIPDAQALRVSPLRPVDVNFFTSIAPGAGTAKAYNHTGSVGNSGKINVVYLQTVETFSLPQKLGYNNIIKYTEMWANQYAQAWRNLRTRQDNLALAYLYSNRNQLTAATMTTRLASSGLGSYWDDTNYALALPAGNTDMFIANAKAAMMSSFYEGPYDMVVDVQLATYIEKFMNQGAGNQVNTSYQFSDVNFARTQVNIDSTYGGGTGIIMPQGQFAGLCWNEGLNVKGQFEDEGGPVGILTTVPDPFGSGAVADISMYTQRADTSSDSYGGSTQDIVDQVELTLTMGYVLAPLSLASDSVAMEVAQRSGVPA